RELVQRLASTGRPVDSVGCLGMMFASNSLDGLGFWLVPKDEIEIQMLLPKVEHRAPQRPEYFSIDWPEAPIVSVVSRGVDLDSIVPEDDWPEFPGSDELARTWKD